MPRLLYHLRAPCKSQRGVDGMSDVDWKVTEIILHHEMFVCVKMA